MSTPDTPTCLCGHSWDMHGPEASGCVECRCRALRPKAPTPDAADERERRELIALGAKAIYDAEENEPTEAWEENPHWVMAAAVLDAVADRLVVLGEQRGKEETQRWRSLADSHWDAHEKALARLAEVEAERDRYARSNGVALAKAAAIVSELRVVQVARRDELVALANARRDAHAAQERAERAEADLAAAEQRGGERALREAADALLIECSHFDRYRGKPEWCGYCESAADFLKVRADRLGTQAEGEARPGGCGSCLACDPPHTGPSGFPGMRMYVCATCGNKRCPAASDCLKWECSGSNDPDQGPPTPRADPGADQ